VHEILQLLFPSHCLLCGDAGSDLCLSCDSKIIRRFAPISLAGQEDVALWPGAYYGDELAQLILMAKEQNNGVARNYLARLLVQAFVRANVTFVRANVAFVRANEDSPVDGQLLLVPIPSGSSSNRKRGYHHGYLLAMELAKELRRTCGIRASAVELLRTNRRVADQSGLNRQERLRNMDGAYSIMRGAGKVGLPTPATRLYLIDDLVTSGSSLREGLRALKVAGFSPSGALLAGVKT